MPWCMTFLRHRARCDGKSSAQDYTNRIFGVVAILLITSSFDQSGFMAFSQRIDDEREWAVRWMMRAPAGLKLHTGVGNFIGSYILAFSNIYNYLLRSPLLLVPTSVPVVVKWVLRISLVLVGGFIGLSGLLDVIADLLAIVHAHIYISSYVLSYAWSGMRRFLQCLWRLFRGLKWNPLRQRVDTCKYELDELLFGTLLFVILCYLSPTVFAFHVLLAAFLAPVHFLRVVLCGISRVFQAFPLHTAYLWFVNSPELPHVTVYDISQSAAPNTKERRISLWNATATDLMTEFNEWQHKRPLISLLKWLFCGPS